jgi:hypothetical protein
MTFFSTPFKACVDFNFLLGLHLAPNFSFLQARGRKLFPGSSKSQSAWVSALLRKALKELEDKVNTMGYDSVNDVGLNSIQKGASLHLASLRLVPHNQLPRVFGVAGPWVRSEMFLGIKCRPETNLLVDVLNMMNGTLQHPQRSLMKSGSNLCCWGSISLF